tara:strand:+ start:1003 stop:1419 length:417 start_codon:yes stop_codon:yes gene_type:complete
MTLMKHNNLLNLDTLLDGFVDNLFSRDVAPYTVNPIKNNFPKAFVDESEKDYTISIAAPGVKKEEFDLTLVGTTLKLNYKTEKKSNRFFNYSAFNKSWTVPDGTALESVSASYEDGVFCINIVKPATTLPKVQKIAVK